MKGYALKKWESTLNFVFMPMDTMYILSWNLLVKIIIPLIQVHFVSMIWSFAIVVLTMLFSFDSISQTS